MSLKEAPRTARDRFEREMLSQIKNAFPSADTAPGSTWTSVALDIAKGMAMLDGLLKSLALAPEQTQVAEDAMRHLVGVPVRMACRLMRWAPRR